MNLIRVPLFNNNATSEDEAKDIFVNSMMEIYPDASEEKIGIMWDTYVSKGIIQLLLDLDENEVVATSITINYQTHWQLNSKLLKKIPSMANFLNGEESLSVKEPVIANNNFEKDDVQLSESEIQEKLDKILDELAEVGFENLSKDKKTFLQQFGQS